MYLERKIDSYLNDWFMLPNHKPLIVKGARQIGKTESIRNFARNRYESFIEINFVEEPKYKKIISDGYSTEAIVKNISMLDPSKRFIKDKTLIFFDELQDFPEIATALKFFAIDGSYDIICSGSLLGIHYKRIESNSVGYKEDYLMFSLDFEEFLWAKGYSKNIVDTMLENMINQVPFGVVFLEQMHSLFLDYCLLGGMPGIVKEYIDKNTFEGTLKLQRQLLLDYQEDIRKYVEGLDQTRILNVFRHIPVQLAKENKKFQISKVAHGARFRDYRGCVEWLSDAGVVNICYCLNFPELPLNGNYDEDKFKLYFADTGLLIACLDEEAQDDLRVNKNLGTYKGALYENIVGEALVKSGCNLFYYRREDSTLEQDFFLRSKNALVPLEVKADNGKAKSLNTLIVSDKYEDITYGIKLTHGNIGFNNNVYTFPYFCTFLLKRWLKEK